MPHIVQFYNINDFVEAIGNLHNIEIRTELLSKQGNTTYGSSMNDKKFNIPMVAHYQIFSYMRPSIFRPPPDEIIHRLVIPLGSNMEYEFDEDTKKKFLDRSEQLKSRMVKIMKEHRISVKWQKGLHKLPGEKEII